MGENSLILLNDKPIRLGLEQRCAELALCSAEIEQAWNTYQEKDCAAFRVWVYRKFPKRCAKIQFIKDEISEKREILNETADLVLKQRIPQEKAIQRILSRKNQQPEWDGFSTAEEKPGFSKSEQDTSIVDWIFGLSGNHAIEKKEPSPSLESDPWKLKKCFREIAKLAHPDRGFLDPTYWHEAIEAYRQKNLLRLEAILAFLRWRTGGLSQLVVWDLLLVEREIDRHTQEFYQRLETVSRLPSWDFQSVLIDKMQTKLLKQQVAELIRWKFLELRNELKGLKKQIQILAKPPRSKPKAESSISGQLEFPF